MNDDCFLYIISILPINDIKNCLLLCKHVNKIIKHAHFWKMRFDTDFKGIVCTNNFYDNYKQYYTLNNFLRVHESYIIIQYYTSDNFLRVHEPYIGMNNYRYGIHYKTSYLNNICTFYLVNSKLKIIPSEIGLLTKLKSLNLCGNHLQTIPSTIFELTNLIVLYLHDNYLQMISPEIGRLINLRKLSLYNNNLQSIPETIVQCTMLHALYINKNQQKFVPQMNQKIIQYR
jgi:Leucine-rich repeat (LRR) protein